VYCNIPVIIEKRAFLKELIYTNFNKRREEYMINGYKNLYNEYESILLKNDALSKENRDLKYFNSLLENQNKTLQNLEKECIEKIKEQDEKIKENEKEIERLKFLLSLDGTNSGIPTSQTPINKSKVIPNTRKRTNLQRGGQQGHPKHKLERFEDDEITENIDHDIKNCPYCNGVEIEGTGAVIEKDETDYKIVVEKKRHKFMEYKCKSCYKKFHENIPNNLKEENQYGPQVQALELTLMNQANVTINKAQKITYGLTDREINLSEGYIAKLQKRAAKGLEDFTKKLKAEIIRQGILQWDDTVIMMNTARGCLRFYGTEKLALYTAHRYKNKEGLDDDGILKVLSKETVVVHDHNKVNYNDDYIYTDAECNRHLLGDLQKTTDNLNHEWSKELAELLTQTNERRNSLIEQGVEEFTEEALIEISNTFQQIMIKAYSENRNDNNRYYSEKENTLITRILDYKNEYLLWIYDFDVPFTNNLSERGLRGVKSKQKASGQFWSEESASWYATIKSYIETCYRNGVNVYNALIMLSLGTPYTLKEILNQESDM